MKWVDVREITEGSPPRVRACVCVHTHRIDDIKVKICWEQDKYWQLD